jgi:DNA repair protein RadC
MAGMTGSGGKSFSVLGDEFWEKFIDEHVAIKKRQETVQQVVEQIPEYESEIAKGDSRVVLEQVGTYHVYGKKIKDDGDLATMFRDMSEFDREKIYVACTDAEGNIIGTQCVSVGSIDSSVTSSREILKVPFLLGAQHFYILHNHPSGDPTPSKEDVQLTKKLNVAANLIGLKFSGHAVIGEERYAFIEPTAIETDPFEMGEYKDSQESEIPLFDAKQKKNPLQNHRKMSSPLEVGEYAKEEVYRDDKKGVYLMCTNTKSEVVSVSPYSSDDLTQNTRALVIQNAKSAFLVGDQNVDMKTFKETAKQFKQQAAILGVELVDAITVMDNHVRSVRSEYGWE